MQTRKALLRLRLASGGIAMDVDFRHSDVATFVAWALQNPNVIARMERHHAILFVSKTMQSGFFVPGTVARLPLADIVGGKFLSFRFRTPRGFSWLMIADYAHDIGIELEGMKRLEDRIADRIGENHVTDEPFEIKPMIEFAKEYGEHVAHKKSARKTKRKTKATQDGG